MKSCEWNPLYNRPKFYEEEAGNCENPIKWGIGFSKAQWFLCNDCVKLPEFKKEIFKFKQKVENKLQCTKDEFEL